MALVLANAQNLRCEVRLGLAISQFEAQLNDAQKATLRQYRSELRQYAFSADDIMRLTSEIDRRHVGQHSTSRHGVGLRFFSFLKVIQRFAAIGDVIIGGAQNLIASGVWTGVRLVLMSIVDASLAVEKLSELFMAIGRKSFKLATLAILFDKCPRLQSHICDYNIVTVEFCAFLLKHTKRSALGRFVHSLSDTALKDFQSRLDDHASRITSEVDILNISEARIHHEISRSNRSTMLDKFKVLSKRHASKIRHDVLQFCSSYDYETSWKQIRKSGRAITDQSKSLEWQNAKTSSTLLVTGKLGVGKSVFMASLVEDLVRRSGTESDAVAYFFCKHDITESLQASTVLGALLRQLVAFLPDAGVLGCFLQRVRSFDVLEEMFVVLLASAQMAGRNIFLLIDGIDECRHKELEQVMTCLQRLKSPGPIYVCLTLRDSADNKDVITQGFSVRRQLSLNDNADAIADYIRTELSDCIQQNRLRVRDPALVTEIQQALLASCDGMYLWAALQIYSLCEKRTDFELREALTRLPKDLQSIYANIIRSAHAHSPEYQRPILDFVLAVKRPLTKAELQDALGVTIGMRTYDEDKKLNEIDRLLMSCGPLLTIDEEEQTVRSLHHSFSQYLEEGAGDFHSPPISTASASVFLSNVVTTYLALNNFAGALIKAKSGQQAYGELPRHVLRGVPLGRLADRMIGKSNKPNASRSLEPSNLVSQQVRPSEVQYPFLSYCRAHWAPDVFNATYSGFSMRTTIRTIFEQHDLSVPTDRALVLLVGYVIRVLQVPDNLTILHSVSDETFSRIRVSEDHVLFKWVQRTILDLEARRSSSWTYPGDVWDYLRGGGIHEISQLSSRNLFGVFQDRENSLGRHDFVMPGKIGVIEAIARYPSLYGPILAGGHVPYDILESCFARSMNGSFMQLAAFLEVLARSVPSSHDRPRPIPKSTSAKWVWIYSNYTMTASLELEDCSLMAKVMPHLKAQREAALFRKSVDPIDNMVASWWDVESVTSIHRARAAELIRSGERIIITAFLDFDVDIDAPIYDKPLASDVPRTRSALAVAVETKNLQMVELLLSYGARPLSNTKPPEWDELEKAAFKDPKVRDLLLQYRLLGHRRVWTGQGGC